MNLFIYANRAEYSILNPVIEYFKSKNEEVHSIDMSKKITNITDDRNLGLIYEFIFDYVKENKVKNAIVLGDRREITFVCLALFMNNIPVVHLAAGDVSVSLSTHDDYFRHMISILSKKQVCFSKKSKENIKNMFNVINKSFDCVTIQNPSLDMTDSNIERLYAYDFDLILMHPQSMSRMSTNNDKDELLKKINFNKRNIVVMGNKDKNYDIFYDLWDEFSKNEIFIIYDNLAKDEFISLMKNADRFLTNSSCSYYEAPAFMKESQIVRIGKRNRGREISKIDIASNGASAEIYNFVNEGDTD